MTQQSLWLQIMGAGLMGLNVCPICLWLFPGALLMKQMRRVLQLTSAGGPCWLAETLVFKSLTAEFSFYPDMPKNCLRSAKGFAALPCWLHPPYSCIL